VSVVRRPWSPTEPDTSAAAPHHHPLQAAATSQPRHPAHPVRHGGTVPWCSLERR